MILKNIREKQKEIILLYVILDTIPKRNHDKDAQILPRR